MIRVETTSKVYIQCDLTGEELGPFDTKREANEAADKAGWKKIKDSSMLLAASTINSMPTLADRFVDVVKKEALK